MIHYHLGTLALADFLDTLPHVPEPLKNPLFSRLLACTTIVNTLNMALNYDRFSGDESPHGSVLLLDPTPITVLEALSRTNKAVFTLFGAGKVDLHTVRMMTSVVGTALTILSKILVTASYALTWLRQRCDENNIKLVLDTHHTVDPDSKEQYDLLARCDGDYVDEFLQEMKMIEVDSGQSLVDSTVARYSNSLANNPGTSSIPPPEHCPQSTDWAFIANEVLGLS